jgi:hypothetical protein
VPKVWDVSTSTYFRTQQDRQYRYKRNIEALSREMFAVEKHTIFHILSV